MMDFFAYFELSFQQWDVIADSYIPVLALLSAIHLALYFLQGTQFCKGFIFEYLKHSLLRLACIILCLIWVYGLMFLDHALNIWPSFNYNGHILDYSTHTALAWVFSSYLFFAYQKHFKWIAGLIVMSMALYLGLMKYQNYHTVADMLTTSLVVLPPMALLLKSVFSSPHLTL